MTSLRPGSRKQMPELKRRFWKMLPPIRRSGHLPRRISPYSVGSCRIVIFWAFAVAASLLVEALAWGASPSPQIPSLSAPEVHSPLHSNARVCVCSSAAAGSLSAVVFSPFPIISRSQWSTPETNSNHYPKPLPQCPWMDSGHAYLVDPNPNNADPGSRPTHINNEPVR